MTRRWYMTPALLALAVVLAVSLMAAGSRVLAQDATPEENTGGMTGDTPRPAHIHAGTCDTLGEVVVPLNELSGTFVGGTPMAGSDMMASPEAGMGIDQMGMMRQGSETTVELPLDDILAGEHAINVHESADNIGNYIACGDITGTATDGQLTIQLNELNGSGYSGEATLVDNGDGTTTVTASIWRMDDMASPMASPMATPSM